MKKIQTFIYVLLMGFAFAACQDDSLGGTEQGGIRIALTDGTAGVDVTTRSTPSELFDGFKQKFKFQIKGGDNYDQTHDWTEDVIPLAAGVYDITATCGTEQADGVVKFDAPCYTGTKEGLKVNAGETATTAEISCKVTNALVSIQFDDEYKEYITDATYAMIAVESGTETNWADLSTSAYFKAGSSLTKLKIFKDGTDSQGADILTDAQKDANFPKTFAAGDHLILTLSIAKANGNVAIKVSKVEVKKVTIEETIPLEWLPKPKVEATGFDNNNTLTFAETETKEAKLNLKLASALQDMRLKFDFGDNKFESLNRDTGYLLSNAEDKQVISEQLGIAVSDNSVDLNNLLAKIQTNAGETTTNTIEVDVKANNRWSSEDETANRTYTITCNKPVFKVDAYPGNIWTKEFTMNALREEQVESGDFTKLSGDMTYQYSADGQTGWTNLSDGMRQDQLQPGTTYYIRGLYRDAVPGEVTEVSTYPVIPLENGDMEYWTEEERGYYYDANIFNSNDPKLRVYYPWNSESFWNTNNNFTTRNRDASTAAFSIVYRYNSFPAVSYTKDANSGTWAAELRNTAAGRGNVSSSESSYEFNNVPGELFIGDISVSEGGTEIIPDDSYSINKGRAFVSRPTALRFYYKYAPYNTDSWKVYIALYDSDDNIIAENTVTGGSQSSYKNIDVPFNYTDDMNVVPAKIYVYFASSIYSGNQLPYHKMNVTTWYKDSQRTDETLSGSVFTIDDIQLIYDK